MLPALLLASLVVAGAAGAAGYRVRRSRRHRAAMAGMARRLAARYEEAQSPGESVPLRAPGPSGRVSAGAAGLYVEIAEGTPSGPRFVSWDNVRHVSPADGGAVQVRIAGVGAVIAPAVIGPAIFRAAAANARAAAVGQRSARVERPRPAGV